MSTYKCPECGSPIHINSRHCTNCEYDVTNAEYDALVGSAPANTVAAAAPQPAATAKPQPTTPNVDTILAHGNVDVSTHHSEDKSTHNIDNSQTVNTTNQTVTNTFIIMGGGAAPIPQNIDPQTAEALKQAQQAQQMPQPAAPQADEAHKGVGSIDGRRTSAPAPSKSKWLIIAAVAVVLVVGTILALGNQDEAPATATNDVEQTATSNKPAAAKPAAKPAAATTTTAKAATHDAAPATATATTVAAKPKQPTLAQMTPDQAYDKGMQYFQQGNFEQAIKHLEKAANANHANAAFQLGEMYFGGTGVDANKETAIRWYKVAANAGHKQAKRKLF